MILHDHNTAHLSYCLNIHPSDTLDQIMESISTKAMAVRDRVCPGRSFGLGLRLGYDAAVALQEPKNLETFKRLLQEQDAYVFTINGFPYGDFRQENLKEKVYQPDWRTASRRDYTVLLCDLLAELLPNDMVGSISTVPCSFKPWIIRIDDAGKMVERLMDCVAHLAGVEDRTGRQIVLGLEPEPGCYLETCDEVTAFYEEKLLQHGAKFLTRRSGMTGEAAEAAIRRHLGVCLDTCHSAIQYEAPDDSIKRYDEAGIPVAKVQLSAALEVYNERSQLEALRPFVEPVYLHQVKAMTRMGTIRSWNDLPDALRDVKTKSEVERLRIHFHVPLHWKGDHLLDTTANIITPTVLELAAATVTRHVEIETYTFDVLPDAVGTSDVVDSVAQEFDWVLQRWG